MSAKAFGVVFLLVLLSACGGGTPTQPTPPGPPAIPIPPLTAPTATLSIVVMGNTSARPIPGVNVTLLRPGSTEPYAADNRTTDAEGRASWTVEASTPATITTPEIDKPHTIIVRNQYRMTGIIFSDAGWLISLPD